MPDQPTPHLPDAPSKRSSRSVRRRPITILILAVVLAALFWGVRIELESSPLQWRLFTRLTEGFEVSVEPGVSGTARFPESGPFDDRLGYTRIPGFVKALERAGYVVDRQARLSPGLDRFIELGGFAVYREKSQAGLSIFERSNRVLYKGAHPERVFSDFDNVPYLIGATLSFIEDRELLDLSFPTRNPAVEWDRLAAAGLNVMLSTIVPTGQRFGGSTLATQLEKFRHSPGGRTTSPVEKLRQVVSASARAYLDGPDTTRARGCILVDYLNSAPLSARAGFGEVIGLGDGLHVWYGTDLDDAVRRLRQSSTAIADSARSSEVYKQVLSLMLALRRPSYYLLSGRGELSSLTETYLRLLAGAGVIGAELRDSALAQPLVFREEGPAPADASFVERKALNAIRSHLLSVLNIGSLSDLDRLDMRVETTLDMTAQRNMTETLRRFGDPGYAREVGLYGKHLLRGNPAGVAYSVTVYERGEHANLVRVQADNIDQPLDLNEGGKFDLVHRSTISPDSFRRDSGATRRRRTSCGYSTTTTVRSASISTTAAMSPAYTHWSSGWSAIWRSIPRRRAPRSCQLPPRSGRKSTSGFSSPSARAPPIGGFASSRRRMRSKRCTNPGADRAIPSPRSCRPWRPPSGPRPTGRPRSRSWSEPS